jgi:hypothetical protein
MQVGVELVGREIDEALHVVEALVAIDHEDGQRRPDDRAQHDAPSWRA